MPVFSSVVATVVFCLLIILIGCYVATRRLSWLIKNRGLLLGVIAVLGIIVYSIGYLASKECGKSIGDCITAGLMAIFSTGRMFVLENDIGELYQDGLTPEFRIAFGFVMTLAMLIIIMVALSVFGFGFISSLRIRLLRVFGTRRTVYIFSCLSKQALALERDIKKADTRALVLFLVPPQREDRDTDEKQLLRAAAENNTFIFVSEQNDEMGYKKPMSEAKQNKLTLKQIKKSLREWGLFRSLTKTSVHFLAFHNDPAINAQTFLKITKHLSLSEMKESVTLHVLTDETLYEHIFRDLSGVHFVVLDINALASHDLMSRIPVISYSKAAFCDGRADGKLTVMLIGDSPMVPFLMKDIITQGQCFGLQLNLIVAAENASDMITYFLADNPHATHYVYLEKVDIKPESAAFFAYYESRRKDIDLTICGSNDESNIRLVKTFANQAKTASSRTGFCALIRSNDTNNIFKQSQDIVAFGDEAIVERASVVINEQLDHMAKAVHQYYCDLYKDDKPWRRLSNYERESSRALALHIHSKLHVLNMETVVDNGSCNSDGIFEALLSSNPQVLENLAKGEHMRWCAHLATHGWTPPPKENEFKRDDGLKQHPCLVDWDDLDRVSRALNKDYKEIDRQLVLSLAEIAANGCMKIVKDESEHDGAHKRTDCQI